MDKITLAGYVANLITIMQAKQFVGGDSDLVILSEYERACDQFMEMLEDEARNSEHDEGGAEEGADLA